MEEDQGLVGQQQIPVLALEALYDELHMLFLWLLVVLLVSSFAQPDLKLVTLALHEGSAITQDLVYSTFHLTQKC